MCSGGCDAPATGVAVAGYAPPSYTPVMGIPTARPFGGGFAQDRAVGFTYANANAGGGYGGRRLRGNSGGRRRGSAAPNGVGTPLAAGALVGSPGSGGYRAVRGSRRSQLKVGFECLFFFLQTSMFTCVAKTISMLH